MNTSNSPLLNLTDSFPGMESTGARAAASQSAPGGEAFGAVYENESASHAAKEQNNPINNKELRKGDSARERAPKEAGETGETGETSQEPIIAGDEKVVATRDGDPRDRQKEVSEAEQLVAEHVLEETLLAGNAAAQPISNNALGRGETLPPGGKILPEMVASTAKLSKSLGSTGDAESMAGIDGEPEDMTGDLARKDSQGTSIRSLLRSDGRELQNQAKSSPDTKNGVDFFQLDNAGDQAVEKVSSESVLEKLTSLSAFSAREPATATVSTTPVTSAAIAVGSSEGQLSTTQAAAAISAENVDTSLNVRGNSTDWSQAIGDKIRWMRNAQASTAELHLNPAELGSIEIKIVTEDQQARVQFVTSSALAQEMIEESLSKLEELLADHGIALDQSDINQREQQNEFAQDDSRSSARDAGPESQFEHEATLASTATVASRIGQVDQYV